MFRGDLLIDGYNLLHAAGLARRKYGPGEFEQCRERLLKLLSRQLFDPERRRTTVVFDAPEHSLGPSPPKAIHGLRVMFADGREDADDIIELLIRQNSAPKRLHVVSSDHRLQRAARRRRAKFYDSDVFLARIVSRRSPQERAAQADPKEKREGLTATAEIEAWLRAFSDVDPTSPTEISHPSHTPGETPRSDSPQSPESPANEHRQQQEQEQTAEVDELEFWRQRIAELEDERERNR